MKKLLPVFAALLFAACSSTQKNTPAVFEGYWADTSGMAIFEVRKQGEIFQIQNDMGVLQGKLAEGKISGQTEQQMPFAMTVRGDTAEYTVMDLTMRYTRIDKQRYENLQKKVTP